MTDLFGQPVTTWQKRNVAGFAQWRNGPADKWRFHILWFDATCEGEAGTCTLEGFDGSHIDAPIDAKSRILVNGRRYGRDHWHH